MAPDLMTFTNTTMKLQGSQLGHGLAPITVRKVLTAAFIDLWVVATVSFLCNALFDVNFQQYLVTGGLQSALKITNSDPTTFVTFASFAMGYFFFSSYLNHGQTYGLHLMKIRHDVASHDMSQALRSALSSLSVYFTLGLSSKWLSKKLEWHDQRYQELLVQRDLPSVNLITAIEISEEMDREEQQIAA